MNKKTLFGAGLLAIFFLSMGFVMQEVFSLEETHGTDHTISADDEYHIHVDFKVYLQGNAINFNRSAFMSHTESHHDSLHLHDGDGSVIHVHAPNQTIGDFFESLGMSFNATCFVDETNKEHCVDQTNDLLFYVNGTQREDYGEYVFSDLDQILISYGNLTEPLLQVQLDSVTDKACISSGRCPERGTPSGSESCGTGTCTFVPEKN